MRPRTSLAAVSMAAALTFSLSGCFSASRPAPTPDESAAPVTSVEPATGELIEGIGYTVNAPEGWAVPLDVPPEADVYLVDEDSKADGFINTLKVFRGSDARQTPAQIEAEGVAYLEDVVRATEVHVRPRVMVAGFESLHFSGHVSRTTLIHWVEQYMLMHEGVAYIITFSLREDMAQADREALAESVLATWTWAPPSTSTGYVYEDAIAGYAVTFPSEPVVGPLDPEASDRTATLASWGSSSGGFLSRGEVRDSPANLRDELFAWLKTVDAGEVGASSADLAGLPALRAEVLGTDGTEVTTIVAGDGNRFYQLIAVGGTAELRQSFFDTFELLN